MIKVQDLRKIFKVHRKQPGFAASVKSLIRRDWIDKVAVTGSTFEVNEGEIVGLIGANGAGKTTLVKMLSGIIHPTSGKAEVLGHVPWKREDAFRRQIALIMGQKAQLWWDLPGADCFELLREIYQIPPEQYRKTLDKLSEMLQIGDEMNIQLRRLSLGERMKMELIAALLHSPRVVYLDEPTIGLDITTQRSVRDFLLDYRQKNAPAMILTSHYMEDIERLCERIIIIREGEIVYDGSLDRVMREYAPYKQLRLNVHRNSTNPLNAASLQEMGKVVECDPGSLCLRVARDKVPEVAAELLRKFSVIDLSIEDPEIGDTIERIMAGKADETR
ncbi:MAG: ATP-binding cassette domain-containing protein [Planctomycetota bacterium]|nr:ATP-binding cassette domain-containing protein [Planctomycetota bacterium]